MGENLFEELKARVEADGVPVALERLAEELRGAGRYHELFDALLMAARHREGLPVASARNLDTLEEPLRSRMEEVYLAACREVGGLWLERGRVREAWMYLRPLGENDAFAAALRGIEVTDENVEDVIGVALHEGVDLSYGFGLVLSHYGICNAITLFDGQMYHRPPAEKGKVAELLIAELHRELMASLKADVARRKGSAPEEATVADLVADREWLFENDNYHVDTTHLASVVRFSLFVTGPESLRLAYDLTEYGRRLSSQYQFAAEAPFTNTYPDHALFLDAMLGRQIDEALAHFLAEAEKAQAERGTTAPAEVYIALLARLGRYGEAIDASMRFLSPESQTAGFAPSVMEMALASGEYARLMRICRERGDLVGYAAGLIEETMAGSATAGFSHD